MISKYSAAFSVDLDNFNRGVMSLKLRNENINPNFFKYMPLRFEIKNKVEQQLNRLLELGVLSPVDYSECATSIVPVFKKDRLIRICGDFKIAINPMLQVDQFPLPRIEDLFVKLYGCCTFSKIDLFQAYSQVRFDEKSKSLVTIQNKSLFRYERLPFDVASPPALFQKLIETMFSGMEGLLYFWMIF